MKLENSPSGTAKAGLTTGIIGTSLGAINTLANAHGLFGGLFGNGGCGCAQQFVCNEQIPVNRYEFDLALANAKAMQEKDLQISELRGEVKFRDSQIYTDGKIVSVVEYFNNKFEAINRVLADQAVKNQANADSFQIVNERMGCIKESLEDKIACECRERKCSDNAIVNYVNATFYPKQVANVTTGTTTTAQTVYNPLPAQTCNPCCC